ncbi:hypothetical protein K458DRAFT_13607 [Lentithecium fluviatile CBS 122367]|uniref:Uncharacterized protein n=1 Tax=Lentithecium fluviatile CBS 122367 TaxID=1168545 RepID=A0A6G1J5P4_9PLEO|nr:hypothetical protein K458DRAFT_13607 [Lentithecium fluviatile CBS 122367]
MRSLTYWQRMKLHFVHFVREEMKVVLCKQPLCSYYLFHYIYLFAFSCPSSTRIWTFVVIHSWTEPEPEAAISTPASLSKLRHQQQTQYHYRGPCASHQTSAGTPPAPQSLQPLHRSMLPQTTIPPSRYTKNTLKAQHGPPTLFGEGKKVSRACCRLRHSCSEGVEQSAT